MKYLEPVHLARLRGLKLSFRRLSSGAPQAGVHRSRTKGRSQEFSEHREYVPGDEIKQLDWKVYARKDRYFVREYQEERNLRTYLMVDGSGSMAFRGANDRPTKWDYACHCAAALAYLVLAQTDAAGLMTFSDKQLSFVPPRARFQTLNEIDATLARHEPKGTTGLVPVMRRFAPSVSRRSLLVLLSDLFGEPQEVVDVLKATRSRSHELLVLRVIDPVERDLDLSGAVLFKHLEGASELRCEVDDLKRAYREEFEHRERLFESSFREAGIGYQPVYTDVPWADALARALAREGMLA